MSEGMDGETLRREFPVELEPSGDGRTLEVRIVPYRKPTRVSDPPSFEPYEEEWEPGAFDRQLNAPNRVSVFVNVEHEQGIKGVVGRGTELREVADDGLHGTFRMLDHPDADKALELVNAGDLTGVSLEFVPLKSVRENGVVRRLKARLVNIALVRPSGSTGGIQAYKDAGVLAVRETADPEPAPDDEPTAPDPQPEPEPSPASPEPSAVEEALARVGYQPLIVRAVVTKPWDGSAARFEDDEYERSCLVCREGDGPPKTRCSLPVLEPNGDLNVAALGQAAARLNQLTGVTMEQKSAAARKLLRYYRQADRSAPPNVQAIAGR